MTPISASQLVDALDQGKSLPPRPVLVTFDDGYDDCHDYALPILEKYCISGTVFVATGHIDSQEPYWFDRLAFDVLHTPAKRLEIPALECVVDVPEARLQRRALYRRLVHKLKCVSNHRRLEALQAIAAQSGVTVRQDIARYSRPMSAGQLAAASRRGLSVHSHTVSHPILSRIEAADLEFELCESRAAIGRVTGREPDVLAYPNGTWVDFGEREIAAARRCGYRAAMTYEVGVQSLENADAFRLLRLPVNYNHSRGWFRTMLAWPELAASPGAPQSAMHR